MPFATTPSVAFTTGFTGTCALDDDIQLQFGSGTDYWFLYRSAGTAFEFKSTNVNGAGADGIIFKVEDGTDDVDFTGAITATGLITGTAGITVGSNIVSDTDSTDDLGSTGVRWANLWVDAITMGGAFAGATITCSTIVASGIIKTDDGTDATSGTDGSLQTDGGLSVVKDAFIGNDLNVVGRVVTSTATTLDNTGTPTVAAGNVFITGGTAPITDFDDGVVGQTIKILGAHTVTITDAANLDLAGGTNMSMTATDTLTLTMYNDQVWVEDARSVNGG